MSLVTEQLVTVHPVLSAISRSHDYLSGNLKRGEARGVRHKVARMLCDSPYSELQRANCEYDDETIVLNGQVSSFYLKQMAQSLVARVAPNVRILNQLQVVYPEFEHPRKPR